MDTPEVVKAVNDDPEGRRPDIEPAPLRPMREVGTSGTAIYAGHIVSSEREPSLVGTERYRTFGQLLANVTIVSAGVRFFLNLVSAAKWKAEPPKDSGTEGEELAERVETMLNGMETSWHRVVRKAAMYRFYGFATLEWTMRRNKEDGSVELRDVENRPQATIQRWDTDPETGKVIGALQTSPQTGKEVNIPREKLVYLVDDSLTDSPEGLGLLRHIVQAAQRLQVYEKLEGFGYEGNMKGIPLLRVPMRELLNEVAAGTLKKEDMQALMKPFRDMMENHVRNPMLALMIDSETYATKDASANPSPVKKWDAELMEGGQYSLEEVARAIERITMEIARVLGVEHLLLGSQTTSNGSYALSKDKSNNFGLIVDSTLKELREAMKRDLLGPLWKLNGWDEDLMPELVTDTNVTRDVESLTAAIRDLSAAGVVLDREDEAVAELFNLLGLPRLVGQILTDPNMQLAGNTPEDPTAPGEDGGEEDPADSEPVDENMAKQRRGVLALAMLQRWESVLKVLPSPSADEDRKAFISRFMGDAKANEEFPDAKQRAAVANQKWQARNK